MTRPIHRTRLFRTLAILTIAAATSCTPGRATPGDPPETQVDILRDIQLTDNARLPEEDGHLIDVEIFSNRLAFIYDGAPADELHENQVVSGVLHGGYLRRITAVRNPYEDAEGHTRVEVTTVPAELGELILDGHFIVHMRPREGAFVTVDDDVGGAMAPLEGSFSLLPVDFGHNVECAAEGSRTVEFDPRFDLDADADVEIDLRIGLGPWLIPRGELHYARFELSGSVSPGITIETSDSVGVSCSWDLLAALEERGVPIPKREWVTTFAVGPVPVIITHTIEPSLSISASGSVETAATTMTADATIGFRTGAEYTQVTGWRTIWEPRREGSVTLTPGQPGTLSVSAGVSGGVGYLAKLYDVAGPGIGLSPGITGTFSADLCEWEADLSAGLDLNLNARLDIPAFDYTLAEYTATQSLLTATIAEANGTFPFDMCMDAGMDPDGGTVGGDGGMPPPPGDGGPPGDAGPAGVCGSASGCQACNAIDGCGYCQSTGTCMNDSEQGSCPGGTAAWQDGLAECMDCSSYGSCGACLGDAFCGWCGGGGGCMTAEVGGAAPDTCSGGWVYTSVSLCM
ncbi:MAG: hypothetical protein H6719_11485 [Sandaracinaceae bacterium]|nr:hypothetical protein [Sandaracinaceae bacterium]